MFAHRIFALVGILGIGVLLSAGTTGLTQGVGEPLADQEGVEVQARGPVHEGFAEPIGPKPGPGPIVPKPPPEPIEELPPDQKPEGENVQWIPGYWAWDEDRNDFLWVSGFWRLPPLNRQWLPGHWIKVAEGWQWVPGHWALANAREVQFLPPPPEPLEVGPPVPAPDANHTFVNGCWVWNTNRYLWRPGFWQPFRPGLVWVPAHYVWSPAGYCFVDGYWDYDLVHRGLLFAPVYIPRHLWGQPRWVYRPRFTVQADFLWGALWVRPSHRHYYFGDYYDPLYQRRGYTAWIDFRFGRHGYDPLFNYYRFQFAHERRWERDLRDLYAGRVSGTIVRPPRTLAQQTTLIQNFNTQKTVNNITNIRQVTVLSPLAQASTGGLRLQPLTQERRREEQQFAQQLREVGRQRNQHEVKVAAAPVRPADPPRAMKLDLPKARVQTSPPLPGKPGVTGKPPTVTTPVPTPRPPITTVQPPVPPKPDLKPTPKADPKPVPTPKPVVPPKADPKPVPTPKVDPKPVPTPKADPKPKVDPRPVPTPKADPKPVPLPKVDPKPVPLPQPTPQPVKPLPVPKVDPKPVPVPKVDPRPVAPPKAEPKPVPVPRVEPKPQPVPQPVKPVPVPPAPKVEPRPQPIPQPVKPPPAPRVEPRPQPIPQPVPQPVRPVPPSPKADPKPVSQPPRPEFRPQPVPPPAVQPRPTPPPPVAAPRVEPRPIAPPPPRNESRPQPRPEVRPIAPPPPPAPRNEVRPPPRMEIRPAPPPPRNAPVRTEDKDRKKP